MDVFHRNQHWWVEREAFMSLNQSAGLQDPMILPTTWSVTIHYANAHRKMPTVTAMKQQTKNMGKQTGFVVQSTLQI